MTSPYEREVRFESCRAHQINDLQPPIGPPRTVVKSVRDGIARAHHPTPRFETGPSLGSRRAGWQCWFK
jgi:hypothetical protein